jgi:hypothetical protein
MLETDILSMFLKEGGFAALFVWMLYSTLKTNKEREENYQAVLKRIKT